MDKRRIVEAFEDYMIEACSPSPLGPTPRLVCVALVLVVALVTIIYF